MSEQNTAPFSELGLSDAVLEAIDYEYPSPIQAQSIPPLLEGRDLLGQAQTGTGKTAAFSLPLLSRIDLSKNKPQVLVLTPTRELAIQVAEAMQSYAKKLPGFHASKFLGGPFLKQLICLRGKALHDHSPALAAQSHHNKSGSATRSQEPHHPDAYPA